MYTVAAALRAETVVYVENLWAPGGVRHTSQEASFCGADYNVAYVLYKFWHR